MYAFNVKFTIEIHASWPHPQTTTSLCVTLKKIGSGLGTRLYASYIHSKNWYICSTSTRVFLHRAKRENLPPPSNFLGYMYIIISWLWVYFAYYVCMHVCGSVHVCMCVCVCACTMHIHCIIVVCWGTKQTKSQVLPCVLFVLVCKSRLFPSILKVMLHITL